MNHQQHLWQADEGCPLDEWSEDEDIAWTTLLGRPALSSDEDEVGREEVPVRREDLVKDQNVVHVNKEELEDDGAGGFVVTEYSVSGQTIVIKQQPLLGIAHQVWHAVRRTSFFYFFYSLIIYLDSFYLFIDKKINARKKEFLA